METIVAAGLGLINDVRHRLGWPILARLPRGTTNAHLCPVSVALRGPVVLADYLFTNNPELLHACAVEWQHYPKAIPPSMPYMSPLDHRMRHLGRVQLPMMIGELISLFDRRQLTGLLLPGEPPQADFARWIILLEAEALGDADAHMKVEARHFTERPGSAVEYHYFPIHYAPQHFPDGSHYSHKKLAADLVAVYKSKLQCPPLVHDAGPA